jgi:hypothetical protein
MLTASLAATAYEDREREKSDHAHVLNCLRRFVKAEFTPADEWPPYWRHFSVLSGRNWPGTDGWGSRHRPLGPQIQGQPSNEQC